MRITHYIVLAALFVLLNLSSYSQDSTQLSSLPTIYTVHIDAVMLSLMQRFEQLDAAQVHARNEILREHNLPVTPSYEFSTSDGLYFSLRGRKSYTEFDQRPNYPDDVRKLMNEKVNPYSDTVHTLLRIHHNEIWLLDPKGSYIPRKFNPDPWVNKYLHLRSEWVKPPMNATYDSILTRFRAALDKQKYPFACIVFYSQYGTGANHYLWHARNHAEFLKESSPEQILVGAYGSDEGEKLYQEWQDCLFRAEDIDADVRPELTDLRKEQTWLDIKR